MAYNWLGLSPATCVTQSNIQPQNVNICGLPPAFCQIPEPAPRRWCILWVADVVGWDTDRYCAFFVDIDFPADILVYAPLLTSSAAQFSTIKYH